MTEKEFARLYQSMEDMTKLLQKLDSRIKSVENQPAYLSKERSNPLHHKGHWEVKRRAHGGESQAIQERNQREVYKVDYNLGSTKPQLPKFYGNPGTKEYIQWERQVNHVFDCYTLDDEEKVKLVVSHLRNYGIIWWDNLLFRRRKLNRPIKSWNVLKQLMREQFVPKFFHSLQTLRQENKSVETYYMQMQQLLEDLEIYEDEQVTMGRFFRGLNKEISIQLDLQPYKDLESMVNIAIKIEKHLQRKSTSGVLQNELCKKLNLKEEAMKCQEPVLIPNEEGCAISQDHVQFIEIFGDQQQAESKDLNFKVLEQDEVILEVCVKNEMETKSQEICSKSGASDKFEKVEKSEEFEIIAKKEEKHEISLWPIKKNERKVNDVRSCEVKSILFSKQNIYGLLHEGICFLTGELKPCFSSVSFELIQLAKELIQHLELKIPLKVNNYNKHDANRYFKRENTKFTSKLMHGINHKVFKPGDWVWRHFWRDRCSFDKKPKWNSGGNLPFTSQDFKKPKWNSGGNLPFTSQDFKFALQGENDDAAIKLFKQARDDDFKVSLQGDHSDSRTNLLEEREDDMDQNITNIYYF